MKTASHQVGHFEIPADGVDNLKNFYSSFISLKWGNTRLLYGKKRRNVAWALRKNPQQIPTQFVYVESKQNSTSQRNITTLIGY